MSRHTAENYAPFLGPPGSVVSHTPSPSKTTVGNVEVALNSQAPVMGPCRYECHEKLGEGTNGTTYKVQRTSDGEWFAAKIVSLRSMKERHKRRAKAELSTLSQFNHFAILQIEDSYETDDVLILVLEYCAAGDLRRQVDQRRDQPQLVHFEEIQVKVILAQLCLAVYHLHIHKQILHRDIKTANVLSTPTGLLKLGDFGFAKDQESAATLCGTPCYQAPEIWAREKYGPPADIWSIGIVAYELFSLRFPFESLVVGTLRDLVLRGKYPSLVDVPRGGPPISREGSRFVDSMLLMDPSQRPSIEQLVTSSYLAEAIEMFRLTMLQFPLSAAVQSDIACRLEEVNQERDRQKCLEREHQQQRESSAITVANDQRDAETAAASSLGTALAPEYGITSHIGASVHGGEGKKTQYSPVYLVLTNEKLIWFQNISGIEEAIARYPTLFGQPCPPQTEGNANAFEASSAPTEGSTSSIVSPPGKSGSISGATPSTPTKTQLPATSYFIKSADIERVQVVPSHFSNGIPNVIAVITLEVGLCFWFKFYSGSAMRQWLSLLQRRSLAFANQ